MHSDNVWTRLHAASRCFPIIASTSLKAFAIQRELVLMLWFDKLLGWNFYSVVAERSEHELYCCTKRKKAGWRNVPMGLWHLLLNACFGAWLLVILFFCCTASYTMIPAGSAQSQFRAFLEVEYWIARKDILSVVRLNARWTGFFYMQLCFFTQFFTIKQTCMHLCGPINNLLKWFMQFHK